MRVEERTPYRLITEYNNYQSPSVGENRGLVTLWHENLTGNGDVFFGQYGRSQGLNPLLDFKYSFPFNAYDTALSYEYRRNTLSVIEQPFEPLNVDSKSDIYTFTLRQPSIGRSTAIWLWSLPASASGYRRSSWGRTSLSSPVLSTADPWSPLCAPPRNSSIAPSLKFPLHDRVFRSG